MHELFQTAKWNDEVCSMSRPGFICKAPKGAVSATQAPYRVGCPDVSINVPVLKKNTAINSFNVNHSYTILVNTGI